MYVIYVMLVEKKLNLVLIRGWGGVFYLSYKFVIKSEIGRCWLILEKFNIVDYYKRLL